MKPEEQNKPTTEQTPGQVMDVQPPAADTGPAPAVAPSPEETMGESAQRDIAVTETLSPDEPVAPAPVQVESSEETVPSNTPTAEFETVSQVPVAPKPSESSPKAAIIAVAVVALLFAAVAVFFFVQSSDDKTENTNTDTSSQQEPVSEVTESDIDSTLQAADEIENLSDENTELPENELSDETLEL